VEVAVALLVPDVAALAADDDRDVVVGVRPQPREVHPEVPCGQLLEAALRYGLLGRRHVRPPFPWSIRYAFAYNGSAGSAPPPTTQGAPAFRGGGRQRRL